MAAAPEHDAAHEFDEELTREAERRGCAVFLLDSCDSDEPTLEELRALPKLFAPKAAAEEMAAVAEELGMVGCDGPDDLMRMTDTSSSYEGFEIIDRHLKRLGSKVRSKDWRGALSLALGLTLAAKGDEFWYCDTDGPEHVAAIWKKLRASWTTILKQPDDVIGLDAPGRAGVASLLKDFRHDLKQYGCL